jgi:hypothetical protein
MPETKTVGCSHLASRLDKQGHSTAVDKNKHAHPMDRMGVGKMVGGDVKTEKMDQHTINLATSVKDSGFQCCASPQRASQSNSPALGSLSTMLLLADTSSALPSGESSMPRPARHSAKPVPSSLPNIAQPSTHQPYATCTSGRTAKLTDASQ